MRSLRKVCAALVLTCAFALSVSADGGVCGEISCPKTIAPQTTITGDIECGGLTGIAVSLLQSVLPLS